MFVQPPAPLVADVALLLAVLPFPYPPSSGIKVKDNSNSFNIARIFFLSSFSVGLARLGSRDGLALHKPKFNWL